MWWIIPAAIFGVLALAVAAYAVWIMTAPTPTAEERALLDRLRQSERDFIGL